MLVAMASVEAAGAVTERAVEARAGAGWVFLAAGEVRRDVGAGLGGEDRRQAPAADDQIRDARHATDPNHLAAAEGQVVQAVVFQRRRRVP